MWRTLGANGNEKAIIWAQQILSKQLRIGNALAQAGEEVKAAFGPEVAQLHEGTDHVAALGEVKRVFCPSARFA